MAGRNSSGSGFEFDGKIGNAAAGIELKRGGDGGGGAAVRQRVQEPQRFFSG